MSENENKEIKLSTETEELINSKTNEEISRIDKEERLRQKHAEDKKRIREELEKAADKASELGFKLEEREDELSKERKEKEALRAALLKQKKLSTLTENEKQMSESERIGKMALDIIDRRLEERYGKK